MIILHVNEDDNGDRDEEPGKFVWVSYLNFLLIQARLESTKFNNTSIWKLKIWDLQVEILGSHAKSNCHCAQPTFLTIWDFFIDTSTIPVEAWPGGKRLFAVVQSVCTAPFSLCVVTSFMSTHHRKYSISLNYIHLFIR